MPGDVSWGRKGPFPTAPEAQEVAQATLRKGESFLAGVWDVFNRNKAEPLIVYRWPPRPGVKT